MTTKQVLAQRAEKQSREEKVESFVTFMRENKNLRLWQGLLIWARKNESADIQAILVQTGVVVDEETGTGEEVMENTFYW